LTYTFSSFTDFSAYAPSLPASVKVSPQFGFTWDFIIDAIIDLEVERTSWPTITFTDVLDRQILIIQIDAASSNLVITNIFEVRCFLCKDLEDLDSNKWQSQFEFIKSFGTTNSNHLLTPEFWEPKCFKSAMPVFKMAERQKMVA
jgi:hypothetical protein